MRAGLMISAAVLAMCFVRDARAETLFTKSDGGTVSLNRGLTAEECEKARAVAKPDPCHGAGSCSFMTYPGTIDQAECLK